MMNSNKANLRFFGNLCNADDKLEEIRAFLDEIEKLIAKEKKLLPKWKVEYEDDPTLYNKKFHFDFTLTRNLRLSVIISIVTLLEIELHTYCKELQRNLSINVNYSEFKGSILDQFKIYSNKLAGLEIDFESQVWQSVKEVVELRNCIVHYDGFIEDFYGRKFSRHNSIKNLSKKFSSIQIEDNDLIVLDEIACRECINIIEKFVNMIYERAFQKFPKYSEE